MTGSSKKKKGNPLLDSLERCLHDCGFYEQQALPSASTSNITIKLPPHDPSPVFLERLNRGYQAITKEMKNTG